MKKTLIAVSGLIVMVGGVFTYIGEENRDRFNPMIEENDVYVLTKGEAEPDPEYAGKRYMYKLNGVDESGNEEQIKVGLAGKDEYVDSYLKVHVKGKYVFQFEEVQEKEIPEKAKEKLKKK
ncbi:YxeA family protein [Bacillus cereus]|uniref:YxeA family protein n=1 Tax=Bacillus cereus TaxID=1396 RepID=UPI0032F90290|nr:YxeA family protein [Bacillus cereus]HDR7762922.1 YxeA family protein [Bacillus cereus]